MVVFEQKINSIETDLINLYVDYLPTKTDYTNGDKVAYKGAYYELVPSSVPINYYPDVNPLHWQKLGIANKESVIDLKSLTKSSKLGGFYVTFPIDWGYNYIAIGYYSAYSLRIEALDSSDNVVKTYVDEVQSINLDVYDLWDYIYAPYSVEFDRATFFKITYTGVKIRITFGTGASTPATCGFIMAGSGINMGKAKSDINFKLNSYSIIDTDEFGSMYVDERYKQNVVDFETVIPRNEFMKRRKDIKKIYDKFCCFIIDEDNRDANNEMVGIGKIQDVSQLYDEYQDSTVGWSVIEAI